MTIIDPNSQIGMIRLRIADWSDLPILSDTVIQSAIDQNSGNIPQASKLCAQYILGSLTSSTYRKMGLGLEVNGQEWYKNYKDFLLLTVKDPAFMQSSAPVPFGGSTVTPESYAQFQSDWKKLYYRGSEDQQNAFGATISPNDGSLLGNFGVSINPSYGWQLTGQGYGYYP